MIRMLRMFTGLAALALSLGRRKPVARPDTVATAPPSQQAPPASRDNPRRVRRLRMPEERARFIAAFLERAFRGRTAISVFCHDRPFPDIHAGGKVEGVNAHECGDGWEVTFNLNHYLWFVNGHVDIELERNAPLLRVDTAAPCGAAIQLVFMPEGGYGGYGLEYYDLWAKARRALDRCEYFAV